MSFEFIASGDFVIQGGSEEESDDSFVREPWPEGQVYFANDEKKTKETWDEWSEKDAYPLIAKVSYVVRDEFKKTDEYGGHIEISDWYTYKRNAYVRGGLAWTAAYHFVHVAGFEIPLADEFYVTSDFDTVACSAEFLDIEEFDKDPDSHLRYVDNTNQTHIKSECPVSIHNQPQEKWLGNGWRYEMCKFMKRYSGVSSRGMVDTLAVGTRFTGAMDTGCYVSWTRLASFFQDKLHLNGYPFKTKDVKNELTSMEGNDMYENEYFFEKYQIDFPDKRHEEENLGNYPSRYGLSDDVPYLMRIEGFGFVETPTVQIGQLLDTLTDYERCARSSANDMKAKYGRRLRRIEHAFRVHDALVEGDYKHGPVSEKTSPFVLSETVVDQFRTYDGELWKAFKKATDQNDDLNCKIPRVDHANKKVTMMETNLKCSDKGTTMNCSAMLADHPFKGKNKSDLYRTKEDWTVEMSKKRTQE